MKKTTPKLSKRLQILHDMVQPHATQYDHIWDGCCDHGLLGMTLLDSTGTNIHFVDVVPHIMADLEQKLAANFADAPWQTHCLDVQDIPLSDYQSQKHLVIIAGVGGDLAAELATKLLAKNPQAQIDVLLCPVHRIYTLRKQLIALDLRLKAECLIAENKRFYEAIWLTNQKDNDPPIHSIGTMLWHSSTSEQRKIASDYLQQTLTHYQKVALGYQENLSMPSDFAEVTDIIAAYQAIVIN